MKVGEECGGHVQSGSLALGPEVDRVWQVSHERMWKAG